MNSMFLQAFGSLVLVIVLIFVVLFFLKKFVYKDQNFTGGLKSSSELKIIGHIMLQPKKYIYIIKFFDRLLVIGLTDNHINVLSEITDKETLMKIESTLSTPKNVNKSFLSHLKDNLGLK